MILAKAKALAAGGIVSVIAAMAAALAWQGHKINGLNQSIGAFEEREAGYQAALAEAAVANSNAAELLRACQDSLDERVEAMLAANKRRAEGHRGAVRDLQERHRESIIALRRCRSEKRAAAGCPEAEREHDEVCKSGWGKLPDSLIERLRGAGAESDSD